MTSMPTVEQLVASFAAEAFGELNEALNKIKHCLNQLNDEQLWWRPAKTMNGIGNLTLHLCGNLRQWIVAGIGGEPDIRERPKEFAECGPISKEHLIGRLDEVVRQAGTTLSNASAADLIRRRRFRDLRFLASKQFSNPWRTSEDTHRKSYISRGVSLATITNSLLCQRHQNRARRQERSSNHPSFGHSYLARQDGDMTTIEE